MHSPILVLAVYCITSLVMGEVLVAQSVTATLPSDPNTWLNSPPLTNDLLKGKAALLYFFEEG